MGMPFARISSKGQITIPASIRRALGMRPNTRVQFVLAEVCSSYRLSNNLRQKKIIKPSSKKSPEKATECLVWTWLG